MESSSAATPFRLSLDARSRNGQASLHLLFRENRLACTVTVRGDRPTEHSAMVQAITRIIREAPELLHTLLSDPTIDREQSTPALMVNGPHFYQSPNEAWNHLTVEWRTKGTNIHAYPADETFMELEKPSDDYAERIRYGLQWITEQIREKIADEALLASVPDSPLIQEPLPA